MNVRPVALLAALLPFAAAQLAYLVAASHGQVEWCLPYTDSCTSISATGRQPPASYLFRATMLPAAMVIMAYWKLNHAWLAALQRRAGAAGNAANGWMLALGVLACIGLILYVVVLGEAGDRWALQRRVGIVLYFSFTYLAQLLFLAQLRRLQPPGLPRALQRAMSLLCIILLVLGVSTVVLDAWNEAWYDSVEDAFEWNLALLLQVNFLLGYFAWRSAAWSLQVKMP